MRKRIRRIPDRKTTGSDVAAADNRLSPGNTFDGPGGGVPARPSGTPRQMEQCVPAVPHRAKLDVSTRVPDVFSGNFGFGHLSIDSTAVSRHQKTTKAKRGTFRQRTSRSRGGPGSRVAAPTNASGYPARFVPLPDQTSDPVGVPPFPVAFPPAPGRGSGIRRRLATR